MNPLIVLGIRLDPHVSRVIDLIEQDGLPVFVVDFREGTAISITVDRAGAPRLSIGGAVMPYPAVIWNRVKMFEGVKDYYFDDEPATARWREAEWHACYRLINALYGPHVCNSLASRLCLYKPYQQIAAASAGFRVPSTLVTTDLTAARAFAMDRDLVMKSLSEARVIPDPGTPYTPYGVMTMPVCMDDLREATDEQLRAAPHMFQEYIAKDHELRVVVVDDQMFAFRVPSQEHRSTEIDWRFSIPLLKFEPQAVSDDLRRKLSAFMQRLGLFTGSFDLIVDRQGEVWFLECNQDGQWGWLDNVVDGEIARGFARAFTRKVRELGTSDGHAAPLEVTQAPGNGPPSPSAGR